MASTLLVLTLFFFALLDYFIGQRDPCASIEFSLGCPWDCSFRSAWTFYSRTYRQADPEWIGEQMARTREPNLFVVDDVAFVDAQHALPSPPQSSAEASASGSMSKRGRMCSSGKM